MRVVLANLAVVDLTTVMTLAGLQREATVADEADLLVLAVPTIGPTSRTVVAEEAIIAELAFAVVAGAVEQTVLNGRRDRDALARLSIQRCRVPAEKTYVAGGVALHAVVGTASFCVCGHCHTEYNCERGPA